MCSEVPLFFTPQGRVLFSVKLPGRRGLAYGMCCSSPPSSRANQFVRRPAQCTHISVVMIGKKGSTETMDVQNYLLPGSGTKSDRFVRGNGVSWARGNLR